MHGDILASGNLVLNAYDTVVLNVILMQPYPNLGLEVVSDARLLPAASLPSRRTSRPGAAQVSETP